MKQYEYNQLNDDEKLIYLIQSSKVELIKHCFETLYLSIDGDEDNIIDANVGYRNYLVDGNIQITGGDLQFSAFGSLGIDLSSIGTSNFTNMSRSEKLAACGITAGMGPGDAERAGLIVDLPIPQGSSRVRLNKYVAQDFLNIYNEVNAIGKFVFRVSSSYRNSNSVPGGVSRHCLGLAVDINAGAGGNPWFNTHSLPRTCAELSSLQGPPWPWPTKDCPYNGFYDPSKCFWAWDHPIVQIFKKHGWGWGGAYGDTMHFSIDDGH